MQQYIDIRTSILILQLDKNNIKIDVASINILLQYINILYIAKIFVQQFIASIISILIWQHYIDTDNININIDFCLAAISILKYCWQYIDIETSILRLKLDKNQ